MGTADLKKLDDKWCKDASLPQKLSSIEEEYMKIWQAQVADLAIVKMDLSTTIAIIIIITIERTPTRRIAVMSLPCNFCGSLKRKELNEVLQSESRQLAADGTEVDAKNAQ
ncbi:unnamed protein product [Heligmosomoides polygyrus]|uniref:Uncharacterized protein n=1 Tax=Heligmosomoides polygyrus TaxID=6339 RepID=A0A183GCC7_HELPZ|nr:unnamed protein product [Heligmosomoides polygyrus]